MSVNNFNNIYNAIFESNDSKNIMEIINDQTFDPNILYCNKYRILLFALLIAINKNDTTLFKLILDNNKLNIDLPIYISDDREYNLYTFMSKFIKSNQIYDIYDDKIENIRRNKKNKLVENQIKIINDITTRLSTKIPKSIFNDLENELEKMGVKYEKYNGDKNFIEYIFELILYSKRNFYNIKKFNDFLLSSSDQDKKELIKANIKIFLKFLLFTWFIGNMTVNENIVLYKCIDIPKQDIFDSLRNSVVSALSKYKLRKNTVYDITLYLSSEFKIEINYQTQNIILLLRNYKQGMNMDFIYKTIIDKLNEIIQKNGDSIKIDNNSLEEFTKAVLLNNELNVKQIYMKNLTENKVNDTFVIHSPTPTSLVLSNNNYKNNRCTMLEILLPKDNSGVEFDKEYIDEENSFVIPSKTKYKIVNNKHNDYIKLEIVSSKIVKIPDEIIIFIMKLLYKCDIVDKHYENIDIHDYYKIFTESDKKYFDELVNSLLKK